MSYDIVDFHNFYQSPLGITTQEATQRFIEEFWPTLNQGSLLAMGYPIPYLADYLEKIRRLFVFMPAQQGVIPWPTDHLCLTSLVDEDALPLADESVDRILLIHSLEHTEQVRPFLREIWRVLASDGRLLIITPNRRGIWARFDSTPFGHGNPYTMTQLSNLLRGNLFTPLHTRRGLYTIPSQLRLMGLINPLWESMGKNMMQKFSGLIGIEASKQVYAAHPSRQRTLLRLPSFIPVRTQRISPTKRDFLTAPLFCLNKQEFKP